MIGTGLLGLTLLLATVTLGDTGESGSLPARYLAKPATWTANPLQSLYLLGNDHSPAGLLGSFLVVGLAFVIGAMMRGQPARPFVSGFGGVFLLAALAYVLASQIVIQSYNLEYALWALAVGLLISHSIGTPR